MVLCSTAHPHAACLFVMIHLSSFWSILVHSCSHSPFFSIVVHPLSTPWSTLLHHAQLLTLTAHSSSVCSISLPHAPFLFHMVHFLHHTPSLSSCFNSLQHAPFLPIVVHPSPACSAPFSHALSSLFIPVAACTPCSPLPQLPTERSYSSLCSPTVPVSPHLASHPGDISSCNAPPPHSCWHPEALCTLPCLGPHSGTRGYPVCPNAAFSHFS